MRNSKYIKMMLGAPSSRLEGRDRPGYPFQYPDQSVRVISTTIPGATLRNKFTYQIETDKTSTK